MFVSTTQSILDSIPGLAVALRLSGCPDRVKRDRCVTQDRQLVTAWREREGLLDQRDAGSRGEEEASAIGGAIDAEILLDEVFLMKPVVVVADGPSGVDHADDKLTLRAAARRLLDLMGRTMALEDRVPVEPQHAIPVLKPGGRTAHKEE